MRTKLAVLCCVIVGSTLLPAQAGTVEISLIPYYAWANRGLAYMGVWIPLAR